MNRISRGKIKQQKTKALLHGMKGSKGAISRLNRLARQKFMSKLVSSHLNRKSRKRDFRSLWITRINAASRLKMNFFEHSYKDNEFQMARVSLLLKRRFDPKYNKTIYQNALNKLHFIKLIKQINKRPNYNTCIRLLKYGRASINRKMFAQMSVLDSPMTDTFFFKLGQIKANYEYNCNRHYEFRNL